MNIFENFIRGPLTTIFGFLVMAAAGYGFWIKELNNWEGGVIAGVGFCLLFMRDKIPVWIQDFVTAILDKFRNK